MYRKDYRIYSKLTYFKYTELKKKNTHSDVKLDSSVCKNQDKIYP